MTRPYSFYGAIRAVIERGDGDSTALITERDTYSFRNLACAVDWYAEELRARGIQKGSHAALWAVNSADWLIAFLAIIKLDAVAVLCNYALTITTPEKDGCGYHHLRCKQGDHAGSKCSGRAGKETRN